MGNKKNSYSMILAIVSILIVFVIIRFVAPYAFMYLLAKDHTMPTPSTLMLWYMICGIPGYRARIRPIVSRITIHWPSFYNVVTGKTLALPNLIALQHIPLSPAGVIAKRPAPIALPNSCAAEWRMAPDAVFSPYASVRYFTPHMVHSQYNLL